jgi:pimeloyl-ACP methyl ester carboxylesterase
MPRPFKVVTTPALHVACEEHGPSDAPAAILLHGWPDDVRTWDGVVPELVARGRRVLVPYLRGYGPTRFRSEDTPRTGQLAALGQDVLDLADALGLDRFAVVGHDWGARAAYIAAAVAPGRVTSCVALSVGWGTNDPDQTLTLMQARNYWYHWYMALDRGARAVREDPVAFARCMWDTWSPGWRIDDGAFAETAVSFGNPDWADVVLHTYPHRWGLAPGHPDYADLEELLAGTPVIGAPTLVIHGGADAANSPSTSENREHLFSGPYERIVLDGVGHFPQRETPAEVAGAIGRWLDRWSDR